MKLGGVVPEVIDILPLIDELTLDAEAPEFSRTISRAIGSSAKRLGTRLIRHGTHILRGRRLRIQAFEERLYERWALPLDLYELCLYSAQGCGEYFNKKFRSQAVASNDCKFEALIHLQAAAARIAGEIYKLLLSGYASGHMGVGGHCMKPLLQHYSWPRKAMKLLRVTYFINS